MGGTVGERQEEFSMDNKSGPLPSHLKMFSSKYNPCPEAISGIYDS